MNINIEKLIEKVEIHNYSNEPQEVLGLENIIFETLGKVVNAAADISQVPAEDIIKEKKHKYIEALPLLRSLIEKAQSAISAIENNKPNWEICQLAVEDIDELTEQISSTILR